MREESSGGLNVLIPLVFEKSPVGGLVFISFLLLRNYSASDEMSYLWV